MRDTKLVSLNLVFAVLAPKVYVVIGTMTAYRFRLNKL